MSGTLWFLAALLPFLWVQRWLHRQIQILLLLITHNPQWVVIIFSLVFLPGVFIHEGSHFLAARVLGVRVGGFSLVPRLLPKGQLQLGAVSTEKVDFFRDAVIGAAPLLAGGAIVALIAMLPLKMTPVAAGIYAGDWQSVAAELRELPAIPDFWLWIYLAFTISSTMMPSASDRRAWLPLIFLVAVLVCAAVLAGAGEWLMMHVAPVLDRALYSAGLVFFLGIAIHLALGVPLSLLALLVGGFSRT